MTRKKDDGVVIPEASSVFYSDDGVASEVLDGQYDPDYEPSVQELREYAEWLGMDPVADEPLMWIAREGLRAPMPEDWRPCRTKPNGGKEEEDTYYFNFRTGDSTWDHPLDAKFKKLYNEQAQRRREGKPFKQKADDEVYEALGIAKVLKQAEKQRKGSAKPGKVGKAGLPDALSQALNETLERRNSKENVVEPVKKGGKFGSLPLGGGGLSKAPLKSLGLPAEEEAVSAAALGRQALPRLGGGSEEAKPLAANSLTRMPLGRAAGGMEDVQAKSPFGSPVDDGQKELDQLRKEHEKIADEERRNHEQMQKRMKSQHEQELQDLEMELEQQRNTARRKNSQVQLEWERELDEQNTANRRRFEKELMEDFESWKREKEAAIEEKRSRIEEAHRESLEDLEQRGERMLERLRREHEAEMQERQAELEEQQRGCRAEQAELEGKRRELARLQEETRGREAEVEARRREVETQQDAVAAQKREIEKLQEDTQAAEAALASNDEMEQLAQQHKAELDKLSSASEEAITKVRDDHDEAMRQLRAGHAQEEERVRVEAEEKRKCLVTRQENLEEELAKRQKELRDVIDTLEAEQARLTEVSASRAQSAASQVQRLTEELEAEYSEAKGRYDAEKQALREQLGSEKEELEERRAALQRQLEEESAVMLERGRVQHRQELEEEERRHGEAMEQMRQGIQEETERHRAELVQQFHERLEEEQRRLQRDTDDALEAMVGESQRRLASAKAAQEEQTEAEMQSLSRADEVRRAEALRELSAEQMHAEEAACDAQLVEHRARLQQELDAKVRQLEEEARMQEEADRDSIVSDMRSRMQLLQATQLEGADGGDTQAVARAQEDMAAELERRRVKAEEGVAQLREKSDLQHKATLTEAALRHKERVAALEREHAAELASMCVVESAEGPEVAADLRAKHSAEIAAVKAEHARELEALRRESEKRIADERLSHQAAIGELKQRQLHDRAQAQAHEDATQREAMLAQMRRRTERMPTPSDSESDSYEDARVYAQRDGGKGHFDPFAKNGGAERQARDFLKEQKRALRKRQAALQTLRAKWETDAAVVRKKGDSTDAMVLVRARKELERQAQALNNEVKALKDKEFYLKQRVMRSHGDWTDASDTTSLASFTPSLPTHPRGHTHRAPRRYAADPQIIRAISSLTAEVRRLSDKVSHIEHRGSTSDHKQKSTRPSRVPNIHWASWLMEKPMPDRTIQCW